MLEDSMGGLQRPPAACFASYASG